MKKIAVGLIALLVLGTSAVEAFPQYAAKYKEPRETSGRIACANCHLAKAEAEVELPQAVLPGQVFDVKVTIPYDLKAQEVVGAPNEKGEYRGSIMAGAYLQLPKGFRALDAANEADKKLLTEEQRKNLDSGDWPQAAPLDSLADPPRTEVRQNIVVVGPIPTENMEKLKNTVIIPVVAPDPSKDKGINFGNFSVYIGANRGRGQVYPDGTPSNNSQYLAPKAGTITKVQTGVPLKMGDMEYEKGTIVSIKTDKGNLVEIKIPPGPELLAKEGAIVKPGDPLTNDPNTTGGGFGQVEKEIVLQEPQRIYWLFVTLGVAFVCQVLLVLKKKQVEKIQEYEAHKQGLL